MTIDEFWRMIKIANEQSQGDMDRKCELIQATVASLEPEAAIAFSNHFNESMNRAYSWSLWGAAYVVNGGCGDDSFSDFRASLISMGREVFESAVSAPDSLADESFDEEAWFYEGYQYAVNEGVEAAISPEKLSAIAIPDTPSGSRWEEEPEALKGLYPQLWRKFERVWSIPEEPASAQPKPWWRIW